jgi:hypothetical protein
MRIWQHEDSQTGRGNKDFESHNETSVVLPLVV